MADFSGKRRLATKPSSTAAAPVARRDADADVSFWSTLKAAGQDFLKDEALRLAAASSYYLVLSLAPLALITISVAALVWGRQAAQQELTGRIEAVAGREAAQVIQGIIASAHKPGRGAMGMVLGLGTLMVGASAAFVQFQHALNVIWNVKPKADRGVWGLALDRLIAFGVVLGAGIVLIASVAISSTLTAVNRYVSGDRPATEWLWRGTDFLVMAGLATVLIALLFKYLPDVKLRWSDVWLGAAFTAGLFTLGRSLLAIYLSHSAVGSSYGAAGSLIVLLIWLYYSTAIIFFGAEFTQARVCRRGAAVVPKDHADLAGRK